MPEVKKQRLFVHATGGRPTFEAASRSWPDGTSTQELRIFAEKIEISDGYHSMSELYEHRIELWIALCSAIAYVNRDGQIQRWDGSKIWRARVHSDGTQLDGWFLLGMTTDDGKQLSYHLPECRWDDCKFAETLLRAPEFDGHTSADVLERLKEI